WGLHPRDCEHIGNMLRNTRVMPPVAGPVTLSVRTSLLLDHAEEQRLSVGASGIGIEYLLLGILGEGHGPAFTALTQAGVDASRFRRGAEGESG
ncbi:MAG: Clp protease N-terminal domain-containing protein, partial [Armatimonadota bacterium]|nr:Clp protease N-terminal domain-containing protein [Armatimonadota bacterium]